MSFSTEDQIEIERVKQRSLIHIPMSVPKFENRKKLKDAKLALSKASLTVWLEMVKSPYIAEHHIDGILLQQGMTYDTSREAFPIAYATSSVLTRVFDLDYPQQTLMEAGALVAYVVLLLTGGNVHANGAPVSQLLKDAAIASRNYNN